LCADRAAAHDAENIEYIQIFMVISGIE